MGQCKPSKPESTSKSATGSNTASNSNSNSNITNVNNNTNTPTALPFKSRRSPIISTNGSVASSQPLASSYGLSILLKGGNAADAALTVAAVLAVVEPCSTGLGGDMFALYYDSKAREVHAVNGSGRCPAKLSLELLKQKLPRENAVEANTGAGTGTNRKDSTRRSIRHSFRNRGSLRTSTRDQAFQIKTNETEEVNRSAFCKSVHSITTPGAARGWEEFYNKFASKTLSFAELLEPAAQLAEKGFPVGVMTSKAWRNGVNKDILKWCSAEQIASKQVPLTVNGRDGPKAGEIMTNPDMARVLRSLGEKGATNGFYEAFPGKAIIAAIQHHGGVMTHQDLSEEQTTTTFPEAIHVEYKGVKLHQVPPNGQGVAGLIALSGLDALEKEGIVDAPKVNSDGTDWDSAETWHAMIEMMRLGFADARAFVCDTDFRTKMTKNGTKRDIKSNEFLLDPQRISSRATKLFNPTKATIQGIPDPQNGTVSFQIVDSHGNAVSFVNSNYDGFGSGLVPDGCGFTLQNRGYGFSLDPNHPNALEPCKRPYHTIIPGMITHADTNELYASISNMGGFMQPQGHLQLTVGLVSGGLNPQAAVDMPRFSIADGTHDGTVFLEEGVDERIVSELEKKKKHCMRSGISGYDRTVFGKAQIIKRDRETGVLWAGSDGRADGCACGY